MMSSEVLPFDHSGFSVFLPHHHCFIYLVLLCAPIPDVSLVNLFCVS
jgi:hypothetical protein